MAAFGMSGDGAGFSTQRQRPSMQAATTTFDASGDYDLRCKRRLWPWRMTAVRPESGGVAHSYGGGRGGAGAGQAAAASVVVVVALVLDATVRWLHAWYMEAAQHGGRGERLPPGEMGWPVVGAMWAFLRAFKSGNPEDFIASYTC